MNNKYSKGGFAFDNFTMYQCITHTQSLLLWPVKALTSHDFARVTHVQYSTNGGKSVPVILKALMTYIINNYHCCLLFLC